MQALIVSSEVESALLAGPRRPPRVEHLEPFFRSACDVLGYELQVPVQRGQYSAANGPYTTHDVTAIVGITGKLIGLALFAMGRETAKGVLGQLLSEPIEEFDELALSAIAELANVTTGRAAGLLAGDGVEITITSPVVVSGVGTRISTTGIPRFLVPMQTPLGDIEVQLAVKSTP